MLIRIAAISALLNFFVAFSSEANVVCYFANWTLYRDKNGAFNSTHVDPNLCTHLNYAFVGINENGTVWVMDDWEATGLEEIAHLIGLKTINPNLKVLFSMGGWNEESKKYSDVAKDPAKRATLIKSVLSFIDEFNFDGFDLDWEYPAQRDGDKKQDKENFVVLLGELRTALQAKGKLLTAAVSGGVKSIDISYDVPVVSANLDMINVMTYDFHGAFEDYVGHNAPLFPSHLDVTKEQKQLNVAAGLQHWIDLGADPKKINLGTATYGRSFTLTDPSNTELYAPIITGGRGERYLWQDGVLGYNEICEFASDWDYFWDDEQKVPHKVSGNQWVGYDDTKSLRLKVQHTKQQGIGGIMVWSLDTDDFLGICGGGRYPLLTTINDELHQ